MVDTIRSHFQCVFDLLISNNRLIIPEPKFVNSWEEILNNWVKNDSIPLFVRKGGQDRGVKVISVKEREIITTDNTPAHWVFKKIILEQLSYSEKQIATLIKTNNFPIAFVKKKSDYETLVGNMVDKSIRLNELGWKLAHIKPIAMKRGRNITVEDYKFHHLNFLSLGNMYLIDKAYSGLAEVDLFNTIVCDYKLKQKKSFQ